MSRSKSEYPVTRLPLMVLAVALFSHSLLAKGVYKCIDSRGHVEYTQFPSVQCMAAQEVRVETGTADPTAIERLKQKQQQEKIAAEKKQESALLKADQERFEREMQEYCNDLRTNLDQIRMTPRVFETDAQGHRKLLTEEEREARIQEKEEALASQCDPNKS